MLYVLTQSYTSCMGTYWYPELGRHQQDGEHLVHSTWAGCINLAEGNGFGLKELLEDDAVLHLLPCRHLNGGNRPCNGGMTEDIIWARWLLNPPRIEPGQAFHASDCLTDIPVLVGVHHQLAVVANFLPHDVCAMDIFLDIDPNLELEMGPALCYSLAAQLAHLLIGVAEPAS